MPTFPLRLDARFGNVPHNSFSKFINPNHRLLNSPNPASRPNRNILGCSLYKQLKVNLHREPKTITSLPAYDHVATDLLLKNKQAQHSPVVLIVLLNLDAQTGTEGYK